VQLAVRAMADAQLRLCIIARRAGARSRACKRCRSQLGSTSGMDIAVHRRPRLQQYRRALCNCVYSCVKKALLAE
jgi:hypothetical protein